MIVSERGAKFMGKWRDVGSLVILIVAAYILLNQFLVRDHFGSKMIALFLLMYALFILMTIIKDLKVKKEQ